MQAQEVGKRVATARSAVVVLNSLGFLANRAMGIVVKGNDAGHTVITYHCHGDYRAYVRLLSPRRPQVTPATTATGKR